MISSSNTRFSVLVFLVIFVSLEMVYGQKKPSPSQAIQYYKEAKAKGMSDAEIQKLALENGYTASDLILFQQQTSSGDAASQVIDDHVREVGALREVSDIQTNNRLRTNGSRIQADSLAKPVIEVESEEIFGRSFFSEGAISFEPNLQIPTPVNYIVGPGDEILIDVSGNAVSNFKLTVSPEGTISLANFPPFHISGLTIEEAQKRIVSRLKTAYSGSHVNVTLGRIRSIRITVTGEARRPGTYTVPSLATAFHALYVSGGPSEHGTMREIEIMRNNQSIKKIDFYKFLIQGDASDNILLADQDIIFLRASQSLVSIQGEVKRPGIFEVLSGESLGSAISFAGGFTSEAYSHLIGYQRNTGKEYQLGQVLNDRFADFSVRDGDKFIVGKILNRFLNRVTIKGAIYREGEYPINEQIRTVSQLIRAADGVTESAFLNRALLYRQDDLLEPVVIPINLKKLLRGEGDDIILKRDDILEIKTVQELREESSVSIFGEVYSPGEYTFRENMTIGDLIFEAGGYTFGGIPFRVEVSRRIKSDTTDLPLSQNVRIFHLNLADNLQMTEEEQKLELKPFDHIFIRKSPRYESQKTFTVLGQVQYPGNYTVKQSVERISDAIKRAGGLRESAYLKAAQFRRNGNPIALDLNSILKSPDQPANLLLQQGDSLLIPERQETVGIAGGVLNPSVMNYNKNYNIKDYLVQSGGFLEDANRKRIFVTHANGITDRTKHFLFFRSYPKVEPGSQIVVPLKEVNRNKQTWTTGERVMLVSSITTVAVTLVRVMQEIWVK